MLLVAVSFMASTVRAENVGSVIVTVQPLPSVDNSRGLSNGVRHGYVEYRITLLNFAHEDRRVDLSCGRAGSRFGLTALRTVHLAGGQETTVSLFQPPDMYHGGITVEVEHALEPKEIYLPAPFDRSGGDVQQFAILTSRSVPQEFRDPLPVPAPASTGGAAAPAPVPAPSEPFAFLRSEVPVSEWSGNWLGYSGYDVIVFTGEEVEQMSPAVRMALRRFLECGGTLLIHADKTPEVFAEGGQPDGDGGLWVGFGRVMLGGSGEAKEAWQQTRDKLAIDKLYEYRPLEKPANIGKHLVAETPAPVRGLFVLVLVFGIGIGPINLWLLSRWKRRIWLWWNVPAISALACMAVFAYALFSEGITGHGRAASFTLLDERCHRATTLGYLSYYCPLTPSVGPHFGIDTDVALLTDQMNPWDRYQRSGNRILDWTTDQWLASGWVTARVPAYLQLRKSEDRRERLTVEPQADGSVKVVNALGAAIRRLTVADASGRLFEAADIPAGAEHTIKGPVPDKKAPVLRGLHGIFASNPWLHRFGRIVSGAEELTPAPGCYVAILDESPFLERPLEGIESEDTAAIVYGISKE